MRTKSYTRSGTMSQKTSRQGKGKFDLSIKLSFPSEKKAEIAQRAVLPELNASHAKRSTTSISIKKTIISISIKADDAVALRAAINGCLNSIILASKMMEV